MVITLYFFLNSFLFVINITVVAILRIAAIGMVASLIGCYTL